MKYYARYITFATILYLTFSACRKEAVTKKNEVESVTLSSTNGNCKALGFGKATREDDGSVSWENLLLKWYDQNGRIKNVKMNVELFPFPPGDEFDLDYGELTYGNNLIRMRDVLHNEEVLSVELDANGRPVVSNYDHHGRGGHYRWDTSYYYYSSDNRLDSILTKRRALVQTRPEIITWKFLYDPAGNLSLIKNSLGQTYEFRYDYTQLNQGMVTLHMISPPTKILEYLDLLQFEQHHQVSSVIWRSASGNPIISWEYHDVTREAQGLVIYYKGTHQDYSYYTAWDCGGTQMLQTKNPTKEEFLKMMNH